MPEMTPEERELFDAQANHEDWSLAHEILAPWVRAARPIGSDQLTQVMEKALAEVERELIRTRDLWETLKARRTTQAKRKEMTEHEKEIERLVDEVGLSRHEAQLRMQDDELWIIDPEVRYGLEGEEAVRQWEQAQQLTQGLAEAVERSFMINDAFRHLMGDAARRAEEALRRARERAAGSS